MSNSEIDKKVKATIDSIESIEEVKVSPFLKDRILQQLNVEEEKSTPIFSWFTPQLQLAALCVVILLNVYAYTILTSQEYETKVEEFADTYDFGDETYTSIFN
jgi:hypothetical protein